MRAMWRGSISFGLINVPIKMYAATEKKSVSFRQIHRECGTPIRYEKTCSTMKLLGDMNLKKAGL